MAQAPASSAPAASEPAPASTPAAAHAPAPSEMARAQQNFNSAGVGMFLGMLGGNHALALAHIDVPDISHIDWRALRAAGFGGVVFDKDGTLSEPFALAVDPRVRESLTECMAAFEGRAVLFSNSAGLTQYDPDGKEAEALEAALGIPVLRHAEKKPAGGAGEAAAALGCQPADIIMVGDRYLTDVTYGNRHGMLTVRVAPLSTRGEPLGVTLARRIEEFFVARWSGGGGRAPPHGRAPAAELGRFVRRSAHPGRQEA